MLVSFTLALKMKFPYADSWQVIFSNELGKVVHTLKTSFKNEISTVIPLQKGIYLVASKSSSGEIFVGKVVVL